MSRSISGAVSTHALATPIIKPPPAKAAISASTNSILNVVSMVESIKLLYSPRGTKSGFCLLINNSETLLTLLYHILFRICIYIRELTIIISDGDCTWFVPENSATEIPAMTQKNAD